MKTLKKNNQNVSRNLRKSDRQTAKLRTSRLTSERKPSKIKSGI
jgi:hypothetical protein